MSADDTYDRAQMTLELMRDEGTRLKPYKDTRGVLTIGTGRNLDSVGISESEAANMLSNDIIRVELELDRDLPWWRGLDQVRQRVLINMAFNMGIGTLLTFHETLESVRLKAYYAASKDMLVSEWARQVGARASRLAAMMNSGNDPALTVEV